jgi:hypothetical protein
MEPRGLAHVKLTSDVPPDHDRAGRASTRGCPATISWSAGASFKDEILTCVQPLEASLRKDPVEV